MDGVQDLSDDQIKNILATYGGLDVPVNDSTRSLLRKKASELLQKEGGALQDIQNDPQQTAQLEAAEGDRNGQTPTKKPQVDGRRVVIDQDARATSSSSSSASSSASSLEGRPNDFPSLSMPALSEFRKFIERGDLEQFRTAVLENPRYLIARGDTPEILKPPSRYNSLHCAVRSGSLPITKQLFKFLEGDEFWMRMYPDDDLETTRKRRNFLIDLYLNTCDKIVGPSYCNTMSYSYTDVFFSSGSRNAIALCSQAPTRGYREISAQFFDHQQGDEEQV